MLKRKRIKNKDEVDLITLFQVIWIEKWKIIVISLIFTFIGAVTDQINKKPIMYTVSTDITKGSNSLFIKFNRLNEILDTGEIIYEIDPENIFHQFLSEFNDYEEMVDTLDNNKFVDQSQDLTTKRDNLFKLAKSFKIYSKNTIKEKKFGEWLISYEWGNIEEGTQLFDEAIIKTLSNVKKKIKRDIEEISIIIANKNKLKLDNLNNELEQAVNIIDIKDQQRLLYLKEQSAIAKELGIEKNMLAINALLESETNNVPVNIKLKDAPYYFRGFAAIDKEISLITNRSPEQKLLMRQTENTTLIYRINMIKSDTKVQKLKEISETLQNDNENNWIEYNFQLADVEATTNTNRNIKFGLILGLLIGIFYAIIINIVRAR